MGAVYRVDLPARIISIPEKVVYKTFPAFQDIEKLILPSKKMRV